MYSNLYFNVIFITHNSYLCFYFFIIFVIEYNYYLVIKYFYGIFLLFILHFNIKLNGFMTLSANDYCLSITVIPMVVWFII